MDRKKIISEFDEIFVFERNIQNDIKSYESFIDLYNIINLKESKRILLDFTKVSFISANLLSILGACVDNKIAKNKERISLLNLNAKIKRIMQKNGFNRYFTWEDIDDTYNSTVDYKVFKANTEQLVEFEKYLQLNIFSRKELPIMDEAFKTEIIDDFLEIFNNVIDHAHSENVYACGQYFPRSANLTFTIVDIGKTINENVVEYFRNSEKEFNENSLKWAIKLGNSTKVNSAPGGLGLGVILEFLRSNNGSFDLLSDNEFYSLNRKNERFTVLNKKFPGTIVTVTINLSDNSIYLLDSKKENIIFF